MDKKIIFGTIALIIAATALFLGLKGGLISAVFVIVFFIPAVFLLSSLKLTEEETIMLPIFLSLGIIPTAIYYPGLVFSLKLSAILVVLIILAIGFFLYKKQK